MTRSQSMIIFALRYCLRSNTYAPALCTQYLIDHWSEFDPTFQIQVLTEIQEWMALEGGGGDVIKIWERLFQHVQQLTTDPSK